ncbi:hypothetical protein BYT27DRAFT_7198411 [Phlegmacium glaucopus]|nr:hypothetical protein BYT27DRAFT_7198411 [Phlegmacium glaucopus]
MLCISRCRTLKRPLGWSSRPLAQSIRPLSQTSTLRVFLRPTPCFRQEVPAPSFRDKVGPLEYSDSFYEKVGKPRIRNQVIFVVVGSLLGFTVAAATTTVETEYWTQRMVALSSVWSLKSITNTDLKRAQNAELIQGLREKLASINSVISNFPILIRSWVNVGCVAIMQPYADASEGKRVCWKICLLNAGVWAAWKIKRWQPFMNRSFMHHPLSGLSYTLLTSMFSHRSAIHLLFNCLALESFGSAAYYYLLREQNKAEPQQLEATTSYHFLAFFISAGLFSGLVSHVVNTKFRYPKMIAQLASPASSVQKTETWAAAVAASSASAAQAAAVSKLPPILPSLGASGAVYAAATMTALAFPESQVALFIPPTYPINIQYGIGGLMMIDVIGILRGWRSFDHWAHLGGAAFGIAYYHFGPRRWHHLREASADADGKQATHATHVDSTD